MRATWAAFAIGLGLLLAPVALGYGALAPILRDVAAGLLVCVLSIAALDWPAARAALLAPAAWLLWSGRAGGDPAAAAVELAAGAALLLAAVAALARAARPVRARPRAGDARA